MYDDGHRRLEHGGRGRGPSRLRPRSSRSTPAAPPTMKKARRMSVSGMAGLASARTSLDGSPTAGTSLDPMLAAGPVLHEGWLQKRTDWKDGKEQKHLKYDRRWCTLTPLALLVRVAALPRAPPAPARRRLAQSLDLAAGCGSLNRRCFGRSTTRTRKTRRRTRTPPGTSLCPT